MTIGFVVALFESARAELFQTERARKVLGMVFFVHSRDATSINRLLTIGAQASALQMIVYLTVRHISVLVER